MLPFYFGPDSRRLFGAFHAARGARRRARGVLMCNPFGQEAIRSHRLFRVIASRLAEAGLDVLRFDYFGTGDSAGDDHDVTLSGWCEDILAAHSELLRRSRASHITWVGARLGATAAARACGQAPGAPQHLVSWDPVIDGEAYASFLRARHVEALETSFSAPDPTWRRRLDTQPASFRDEAIGFAISAELRRELAGLNAGQLLRLPQVPVTLIADPADHPAAAWAEGLKAHGIAVTTTPMARALEWTSDDSLNAALVPAQAVQQLLAVLDA